MQKKLHALFVMFLTLLLSTMEVSGQVNNTKITLSLKNAKAEQFFSALEKQTGFTVLYRKDIIDATKTATIICNKRPLTEVLDENIAKYNLEYKIVNKTIVITKKAPAPLRNEQVTFSGIITEKNGKTPVVGATIII